MDNNTALILPEDFKDMFEKERSVALRRFLLGRTPKDKIKWRESKTNGPKDTPYVTGSYMIRQVGLVTGFKWSHEVIGRRTLPDWWKEVERVQLSKKETYTKDEVINILNRVIMKVPREIMTDVKVSIYDAQDREFVHTATGVNKVKYLSATPTIPVSIGNAEKASETDAIKKALANMGFCPDVYGPKEELEEMAEYVDEK